MSMKKLNFVNGLLRQLQEDGRSRITGNEVSTIERSLFSASSANHIRLNTEEKDASSVLDDDCGKKEKIHGSGITVSADLHLSKGTNILTCASEGFVLEKGEIREEYCSYCCTLVGNSPLSPKCPGNDDALLTSPSLNFCLDCRDCDGKPMIGYCSNCVGLHKLIHIRGEYSECRVLRCLVESLTRVEEGSTKELSAEQEITNHVIHSIFNSSVALLTLRLACIRNSFGIDTSSWWKKFQLIHEHQLPAESPYQSLSSLLANALDAVRENAAENGSPVNDDEHTNTREIVSSILGRVLGCSHAIVDPERPLGKQTLGRAIFVGHSFYNHSCKPNAYLSMYFPTKEVNVELLSSRSQPELSLLSTQQTSGLSARVHIIRPIEKGEEITLSYLPLSGLSTQERQLKLENGYSFQCKCIGCSATISFGENGNKTRASDPLALPVGCDFESIGSIHIDSVRHIQYDINDQLLALQSKINRHEVDSTTDWCNSEEEVMTKGAISQELENIFATITMVRKGIRNQCLPECHEVSIECDRLGAAAGDIFMRITNEGERDESQGDQDGNDTAFRSESYYQDFFRKVSKIQDLFDPVALGTQRIMYCRSLLYRSRLHRSYNKHAINAISEEKQNEKKQSTRQSIDEKARKQFDLGLNLLRQSLGRDHPWISSFCYENLGTNDGDMKRNRFRTETSNPRSKLSASENQMHKKKRQRMSGDENLDHFRDQG